MAEVKTRSLSLAKAGLTSAGEIFLQVFVRDGFRIIKNQCFISMFPWVLLSHAQGMIL